MRFKSLWGTRILIAVAISIAAPSTLSLASPLELLGADVRSAGMAGLGGAHGHSASALFYNPATLIHAGQSLELGINMALDHTQIMLHERPSGYDVPDLGHSNPTIPSSRSLEPRRDTDDPSTLSVFTIGGITNLGQERLRLALLVTLPIYGGAGQENWFVDERERLFTNQLRFELLGSRVRRFDVEIGGAYQVIDMISIGLSAQYLPSVQTDNDVYLPDVTEQGEVDLAMNASQGNAFGLGAGILFEPTDYLRFGASWRDSISLQIKGSNIIRIRGLDDDPDTYPVIQRFTAVPFYSPSIITFAAAWDIGKTSVTADLRHIGWSNYIDRNGDRPGFRNVFSPAMGVEHQYTENTTLRAGWSWHPSPVPAQTGRTNYVDNNRLTLALGASHDTTVRGSNLQISWFAQLHLLETQTTHKDISNPAPACVPGATAICDEVPDDLRNPQTGAPISEALGLQTGNPGFPGYTSGGWIAAIGIQVRHVF